MDIYVTKGQAKKLISISEFGILSGYESYMQVFPNLYRFRKYKDLIIKHYKKRFDSFKQEKYLENKRRKVDYMKELESKIVSFPVGGLYEGGAFVSSLYKNLGPHIKSQKLFEMSLAEKSFLDLELKIKMLLTVNSAMKDELHPSGIYTYDLHGDNIIYSATDEKFYIIDVCGYMAGDIPTSHQWVNCCMVEDDGNNEKMQNKKFYDANGEIIFGRDYDMKVLYELLFSTITDLYSERFGSEEFADMLEFAKIPDRIIEEFYKVYDPNKTAEYFDEDMLLKLATDYKLIIEETYDYGDILRLERKI